MSGTTNLCEPSDDNDEYGGEYGGDNVDGTQTIAVSLILLGKIRI
jgi:hypothetical protein